MTVHLRVTPRIKTGNNLTWCFQLSLAVYIKSMRMHFSTVLFARAGMTLHVAHENNEPANGGKVTDPATAQIQDVLPLSPSSLYRPEVDTSAIDPRKLKRKIDFRILPWLALLYLVCILDRGSIGNARVCARCTPTLLAFSYAQFRPPLAV